MATVEHPLLSPSTFHSDSAHGDSPYVCCARPHSKHADATQIAEGGNEHNESLIQQGTRGGDRSSRELGVYTRIPAHPPRRRVKALPARMGSVFFFWHHIAFHDPSLLHIPTLSFVVAALLHILPTLLTTAAPAPTPALSLPNPVCAASTALIPVLRVESPRTETVRVESPHAGMAVTAARADSFPQCARPCTAISSSPLLPVLPAYVRTY
ncbi:hypothetical protein C8F04DRAFT_1254348 [Mycena alexandri]|uniref:Uncharacterized protein n=1 Tax=Mycena alexandri TaxID=1745969 RepID=A0AAD6X9C8_9AGAR|nr:hypothetical protein C8F04DRAFT_1254348 [Mycena alexandri]